jgi:sarcosine oxidase subunit gamma
VGHDPGVIARERSNVALFNILARKGADERLAERAHQEFGIELPETPRCVTKGPVTLIWSGAKQWLAMAEGPEGIALGQRLRTTLVGVASIMDQSDGRSLIRISGPRARDTLAKGVHIDLHPSVFRASCTAITVVSYINVQFWQVDETPTYELAMFRSFAAAFWEWLADSAAEYGFAVA